MSDFLYPFLEGERPDVPALLADLADSAMAKAADSTSLAVATLEREGEHVEALAGEMARALRAPAAGCSRSATAAARPTPRRSPGSSPHRRGDGRCPPVASSRTRPC